MGTRVGPISRRVARVGGGAAAGLGTRQCKVDLTKGAWHGSSVTWERAVMERRAVGKSEEEEERRPLQGALLRWKHVHPASLRGDGVIGKGVKGCTRTSGASQSWWVRPPSEPPGT